MSVRSGEARRRLATAGVAFLILALVGCGPTLDPGVGRVEGTVATMGGQSTAAHPAEAKVIATPLGADAGGSHSIETDASGSFTLDLPPGEYEFGGTLTTLNPGDQLTPQTVTVTAGETTAVELFAIYP